MSLFLNIKLFFVGMVTFYIVIFSRGVTEVPDGMFSRGDEVPGGIFSRGDEVPDGIFSRGVEVPDGIFSRGD